MSINETDFPIKSLSASSIRTYDFCPYKFKLSYIDKIPIPIKGNEYTSFGKAIHSCVQLFYKLNDKSKERLYRMFLPFFKSELKYAEIELSEETIIKYTIRSKLCLDNFYAAFIEEDYFQNPHEQELRFNYPYDMIKLKGFIDYVSKFENGIIVDYKTGKNPPTKAHLKDDVQLTMYGLIATKQLGMANPRLCLFYLDLNKKLYTERTSEQYDAFLLKIDSILDHVKSGKEFVPITTDCNMCEYKDLCPYSSCKKYYIKHG